MFPLRRSGPFSKAEEPNPSAFLFTLFLSADEYLDSTGYDPCAER
jgi:hypothetical protein